MKYTDTIEYTDADLQTRYREELGRLVTQHLDAEMVKGTTYPTSPIEAWLYTIPTELDAEAITAVLRQHFPELFI